MRYFFVSILSSILIVLIDQYSKFLVKTSMILGESIAVIDGFFNITFVKNSGVAFGLGASAFPIFKIVFFLILPVVACCWLIYLIWGLKENQKLRLASYTLILGGAIGNLIDRFKDGAVVDFFDFYIRDMHFATFNVADSAITVAAFLLIIDYILEHKKI